MPPLTSRDPAAVFLVGLGMDAEAMANFCRRHVLDLISVEASFRAVLYANSQSIDRIPVADVLLGRWPRGYAHFEDLRDTLIDGVLDLLNEPAREVAVVLVAPQPSTPQLRAVLTALSAVPDHQRTRLWSIAALMCGPGCESPELAGLLGDPTTNLGTAFLLGNSSKAPTTALAVTHSGPLRCVLDIARDSTVGWDQLRWRRGSTRARVLWFAPPLPKISTHETALLGYLSGAMRKLADNDQNLDQTDSLLGSVNELIGEITPPPETSRPEVELPDASPAPSYAPAALREVDRFTQDFLATASKDFENIQKALVDQQNRDDLAQNRDVNSVVEKARNIVPADGGFSAVSRNKLTAGLKDLDDQRKRWIDKSDEKRSEIAKVHDQLERREIPDTSIVIRSALVAGRKEIGFRLGQARRAALAQPTGRWSLILLSIFPLLLVGLTLGLYVVQPGSVPAPVGTDNLVWLWWMVCLLGLSAAVPAALTWWLRRTLLMALQAAFSRLRTTTDEILKLINSIADSVQTYTKDTHAARLAEEVKSVVSAQIDHAPRLRLDAQQKELLQTYSPIEIETAEMREIQAAVRGKVPQDWVRAIVALRMRALTGAGWRLLVKRPDGPNVDLDHQALVEEAVRVPSDWCDTEATVVLAPIAWQTREQALPT